MKNFIKGKWFPLVVAILIVSAVAFVMALFGWRITYAPELANDWDAISAVAAWVGAIGAVAAVFSAIYVANQQNKIALFEKRFDAYCIMTTCVVFGRLLKAERIDPGDPHAKINVYNWFMECFSSEIHGSTDLKYMLTYIKNVLGNSILLFEFDEEEKAMIVKSAMALIAIMETLENVSSNKWCNEAIDFLNWIDDLEKDILIKMANQLKLSK